MTTAARYPGLGRGMAAQLQRVNESPARLRERIAELEQENKRLYQLLAKTGAADVAPRPASGEVKSITVTPFTPIMHSGRPAATAAQIAQLHHVNISNVYRQLQKNKLAGAFVSGHWVVYTDQDIRFKSYQRRS